MRRLLKRNKRHDSNRLAVGASREIRMGYMPVLGSRLYGSVTRTDFNRVHRAVTALKLWRGKQPQRDPVDSDSIKSTEFFEEHFLLKLRHGQT